MLKRKKREFQSSELLKSFAKIYGFEHKLFALEVQEFLSEIMDYQHFSEIISVNYINKILLVRVKSPLMRNDFQLKKSYFLQQIQNQFGVDKIEDLEII